MSDVNRALCPESGASLAFFARNAKASGRHRPIFISAQTADEVRISRRPPPPPPLRALLLSPGGASGLISGTETRDDDRPSAGLRCRRIARENRRPLMIMYVAADNCPSGRYTSVFYLASLSLSLWSHQSSIRPRRFDPMLTFARTRIARVRLDLARE